MTRTRKPRVVKAWAGYSDGRLHWYYGGYGMNGTALVVPAIYKTRKQASSEYEDFRRVLITHVPKSARRKLPALKAVKRARMKPSKQGD